MISREEAERLKERLLSVLVEDAHNSQRLLSRLDQVAAETGIGAFSALLLILARLSFEEQDAKRHWEAILDLRDKHREALGRDVGVRVALIDYFMNVNRRLVHPALIDVEVLDSGDPSRQTDVTTGLASDRHFRSALQAELRRARRYHQKVALVLFDLDDFAEVNTRVGDRVGDRLLRETAILLHNKIRDIDVAARPGEDELAALLPETDRSGALLVAERFRREVEGHFSRRESGGRPVGLTVSGGIACYPEDATTPQSLVERAARALYMAKASGKNVIHAYAPERRRYLRFELDAGRFEVEVLGPHPVASARPANLSRSGIVFSSPEPIDVGERIEIRLARAEGTENGPAVRLRGNVVRLEAIPEGQESAAGDRFDIGLAFDIDWKEGEVDLLEFLERSRMGSEGART